MFLVIALNVIFAIIVVGAMVGLHAHAILASRASTPAQPRRPRTRTQVARGRLVPARG